MVASSETSRGLPGEPHLGTSAVQRRPTKLTLDVVKAIADQIVGGRLPAETLLPSEAVMSDSFGVSRTVIRESLNVLENMGLIEKRRGKLSWTCSPDRWDVLDPIVLDAQVLHDRDFVFLDNLVAVRIALEAEMAGLAAARATEEDLALMRAILTDLEGLLDQPERYKYAETAFHNAVMQSARNRIGLAIITSIHDRARASGTYEKSATPLELVRLSHDGHVAVLERICAGDPPGAALAMRQHIGSAWAWRRGDAVRDGRDPLDGTVAGPAEASRT
ncbi:MAG: lutR 1 [Acidimicrobiaceae bacterium]|nr:lutR 1 [Acidimicrobiaceae bacterium]